VTDGALRIVVLGLSITSSWGNGHATGYRALVRALDAHGHDVLFLERDVPWYAEHRDLASPPWGATVLYGSLEELDDRCRGAVAEADVVIVGSYVPEGAAVCRWVLGSARGVTAFYDIDTPVTIAALEAGTCGYLDVELVPCFDLYLSFTGGPALEHLARRFGALRPRAFHCFVDADAYAPVAVERRWDLGYLGTYSDDRQPALDRLLLAVARQRADRSFAVAGPQYPDGIEWPANVTRLEHLAPAEHPAFYCSQRLTLNITRADMVRWGWSPSVRLFEAAACGVAVVSDRWEGLDALFRPDREVLVADGPGDVVAALDRPPDQLDAIGRSARATILARHTAEHRATELLAHVRPLLAAGTRRR
jgi:spore maturation protein CgeB